MNPRGKVMGAAAQAVPRLEARELSKSFPGTLALDRVSLRFDAGKVSAVIGKNGAGKSTLVRIVAGAIRPASGTLLLDGRPMDLASPRDALERGIATVHQELSLIPGLSVGENILFGRLPRRRGFRRVMIDWPEVDRRSEAILAGLGVRLNVRAPVSALSLAQQQMVEIARVQSFEPRVVLFDEPTAGLARAEVDALFALIRGLARGGVAVVYVTHRLSELREIADTVTALRDGKHVATIPIDEANPLTLAALMFGETPTPRPSRTALATPETSLGRPARETPASGATPASGPKPTLGAAPALGATPASNAAHDSDAAHDSRVAAASGSLRAPSAANASRESPAVRPTAQHLPQGAPVLEVRGLGLDERLFDIDLTLHKGEVLGLAGMLGSGRTELLMCLFGAIQADRGEIRIHGGKSDSRETRISKDNSVQGGAQTGNNTSVGGEIPLKGGSNHAETPIQSLSNWASRRAHATTPAAMKARGLALVPENRKSQGLVTRLSTLDNLSMAALGSIARRGVISRSMERAAVRPIIEDLQISVADLDAPVAALSGGNQQKVVVGKWLQTSPRIILFDEPTRGIDVQAKRQVFEVIRRLSSRGVAAIFVSSELEELLEICDRILVMRSGRVVDTLVPDGLELGRLLSLCMGA